MLIQGVSRLVQLQFSECLNYYRVIYVDARKVNTLCLGFTPVSADVFPSGHRYILIS